MADRRAQLPKPFRLRGLDLIILALGLVGVVAFAMWLPEEHPDSAAVYEIDEQVAVDRANVFLVREGFAISGLETVTRMRRRTELLSDLQHTLGRKTTTEFLNSESRYQVAAYYWSVSYLKPPDADDGISIGETTEVFHVTLAQNGDVLSFQNNVMALGAVGLRYGSPAERINHAALSTVVRADTATNAQARTQLVQILDSLLYAGLSFDLIQEPTAPGNRLNALIAGDQAPLDSTAVLAITEYHLSRTAYADMDVRLDSLSIIDGARSARALVRMVSDPPVAGQIISVESEITPTGTLTSLDVSYEPSQELSDEASTAFGITKIGLYVLLGFAFIIVFFRRLAARLLDMKSALVDAMILGIMAGATATIASDPLSSILFFSPIWLSILIRLIVFSVVAGVISVFVFMLAGTTDSVVRESRPGKLGTLTLLRHGDFQNQPMGAALLRGTALGGMILGISTLSLVVFDGIHVSTNETFLIDATWRPAIAAVLGGFESAYFLSILWLVGISAVGNRLSSHPAVTIILLTLTGAFLGVGPMALEATIISLVPGALISLFVALFLVRYDIVTAMAGMFSANILWSLSEGFLVSGIGSWIDLLLGGLFIGSILILGFVGASSKRTGKSVANYVPEYVTEMAGQERARKELEIAHQVQSFFLPRQMPEIPGLDIAGMCLSATEVGGDYYDFIELEDDRLAFVLGDVSGKGIQAAFFMTLVKGIVQTLSRQNMGPAAIMTRLNHLFCENAPAGTFISVVYGEIDPKARTFTFARAGHNPVIWYNASQKDSSALRPNGMAIGFTRGQAFEKSMEEQTIEIEPGDALVFYTDGFSEAMNRSRELYGDDRLVEKVTQIGGRSSSAILRMMTEDVHHFIEGMGRADDMTMAVIKLAP